MNTPGREKFEKWWSEYDCYDLISDEMRAIAWDGYQAALSAVKSEIDDLKFDRMVTRSLFSNASREIERLREELSSAPTPPETERKRAIREAVEYLHPTPTDAEILQYRPSGNYGWQDMAIEKKRFYEGHGDFRIVYTSLPSPKAEWDAEGNPLNLEAAARDAIDFIEIREPWMAEKLLRKFLKD